MLNDDTIKRLAEQNSLITPFNMEQLQPHSFDCTLGEEIKIAKYNERHEWLIDTTKERDIHCHLPTEYRKYNGKTKPVMGHVALRSMQFALGGTIEYFKLPQDIVGFVQGKSTIGRNGLQIECAGLIDAGFEGNITLEFFNMAPWSIELKYGQKICQVHFTYVDSPVYKDYKKIGHYNKQTGATTPVYNL